MNRQQAEQLLGQLILDELDGPTRDALLVYLETDPQLREQLADMRLTVKLLQQAAVEETQPVLSDSSHRQLMKQVNQAERAYQHKGVLFSFRTKHLTLRRIAEVAAVLLIGTFLLSIFLPSLGKSRELSKQVAMSNKTPMSPEEGIGSSGGAVGVGGRSDGEWGFNGKSSEPRKRLSEKRELVAGDVVDVVDAPMVQLPGEGSKITEKSIDSLKIVNRNGPSNSDDYYISKPTNKPVLTTQPVAKREEEYAEVTDSKFSDARRGVTAPRYSSGRHDTQLGVDKEKSNPELYVGHLTLETNGSGASQTATPSRESVITAPATSNSNRPLGEKQDTFHTGLTLGDDADTRRYNMDYGTFKKNQPKTKEEKVRSIVENIILKKDRGGVDLVDGTSLIYELESGKQTTPKKAPQSRRSGQAGQFSYGMGVSDKREADRKQILEEVDGIVGGEFDLNEIVADPSGPDDDFLPPAVVGLWETDKLKGKGISKETDIGLPKDSVPHSGIVMHQDERELRLKNIQRDSGVIGTIDLKTRNFSIGKKQETIDYKRQLEIAADVNGIKDLLNPDDDTATHDFNLDSGKAQFYDEGIEVGQSSVLNKNGDAYRERFAIQLDQAKDMIASGDIKNARGYLGKARATLLQSEKNRNKREHQSQIQEWARMDKQLQGLIEQQQQQQSKAQAAEEQLATVSKFKLVPVNPWVLTAKDHQSTFALDVDDASYAICRNYIMRGYLPPRGAVRMEAFVNHFDYNYPKQAKGIFQIDCRGAASPFINAGEKLTLLKIGVQGKVIGREGRRDAHLVFVVDTSGSMARPDRLPLVKYALRQLIDQLGVNDRISLVTYGTGSRLILENEPMKNRKKIHQVIASLRSGGSTNMLNGLEDGYKIAERSFKAGKINRVMLLSDGVANIGETDAQGILKKVKIYKTHGITFTAAGFGAGGYNDAMLEQLAKNGDGNYVFIDSKVQAQSVFVDKMNSTLQTIAKDAKIQVEFNPDVVRRYRLVGYEKRDIADKDFRNDTIDAAEVGSGQAATALYEVELIRQPKHHEPTDLGTVYVRYKDVDTNKVHEISKKISRDILRQRSVEDDPRFYLAACAARFAEILRASEHVKNGNLQQVQRVIEQVCVVLPLDQQARELLMLVRKAQGLPRSP